VVRDEPPREVGRHIALRTGTSIRLGTDAGKSKEELTGCVPCGEPLEAHAHAQPGGSALPLSMRSSTMGMAEARRAGDVVVRVAEASGRGPTRARLLVARGAAFVRRCLWRPGNHAPAGSRAIAVPRMRLPSSPLLAPSEGRRRDRERRDAAAARTDAGVDVGGLLLNAWSSSQPDGSLVAALVAEQENAGHSGWLLRFVQLDTDVQVASGFPNHRASSIRAPALSTAWFLTFPQTEHLPRARGLRRQHSG
jgi:hypothetical protein